MSPFSRKENEYDFANATFRHHIIMLDGKHLDGCSKTKAYSEKSDKLEVLMGVIQRVWFKNSYRTRAESMEIYWQDGPIRKHHPRLLKLTQSAYQIEAEALTIPGLDDRLRTLYMPSAAKPKVKSIAALFDVAQIEAAERAEAQQRLKATSVFNPILTHDPFNKADHFQNMHQLHEYCNLLINQGQPQGLVGAYFRDMQNKYPHKYKTL
jgi:hypothetical protein